MSLSPFVIHVIPLQISLNGTNAIITCNDPRAKVVEGEIILTLNAPNPKDPPAPRRICFVVEDLADEVGYDNYFNMFSGPPLERLVPWKRSGTVSRSPELLVGRSFEIVAVAYSVPKPDNQLAAPVKVGHGRRRFKLTDTGGGGDTF